MTHQRKAPAREATAPRAESRSKRLPNSRRSSQKGEAEFSSYWIHVEPDGTERRFAERPENIPTLLVSLLGDIERTHTYDRELPSGEFVSARPPGEGWAYVRCGKSWSSRWVRPARRQSC
jgi:hypothetical protein